MIGSAKELSGFFKTFVFVCAATSLFLFWVLTKSIVTRLKRFFCVGIYILEEDFGHRIDSVNS